jgi:hypothetical protein
MDPQQWVRFLVDKLLFDVRKSGPLPGERKQSRRFLKLYPAEFAIRALSLCLQACQALRGILENVIGERIDADLIRAHWDDILRLATSIRTRTVSASLMLKRLSSTAWQNGLAQALRQMGRIERTLFALDWITDKDLRQTTTAELNKGEARNSLVRAVNLHRLGRFRDRSHENLSIRASALNLVVTAIIYWNTLYMGRIVDAIRAGGDAVPFSAAFRRSDGNTSTSREITCGRRSRCLMPTVSDLSRSLSDPPTVYPCPFNFVQGPICR